MMIKYALGYQSDFGGFSYVSGFHEGHVRFTSQVNEAVLFDSIGDLLYAVQKECQFRPPGHGVIGEEMEIRRVEEIPPPPRLPSLLDLGSVE